MPRAYGRGPLITGPRNVGGPFVHRAPRHRTMTESVERKRVIAEWAQRMAELCEGPDAGWAIYTDWLRAFLHDIERRGSPSTEEREP